MTSGTASNAGLPNGGGRILSEVSAITVGVDSVGTHTTADSISDSQTALAIRLIIHLSKFGSIREDGAGRPEASQLGMASALTCTQGAVSKITSRLGAVGMIRSERRRVTGMGRRVEVYSLTRAGESLADEIRTSPYSLSPSYEPGRTERASRA
jgi:DNA-binding MarR family transcriptional regulator